MYKCNTIKIFVFILAVFMSAIIVNAQGGTRVPESSDDTGARVPETPVSQIKTVTLQNPLNVNSVGEAVNKGVEIFSYIAVLGAVIALIIVGLRFIMAQGKPDKLKEAGQWLWYIVIGVAIILGARLMISVVINTLEATKTVNPGVIQSVRQAVQGQ